MFAELRRRYEERALEKNVAHSLNVARAHQKNGIPLGDPCYRVLLSDSMNQVEGFSKKHGVKTDTLLAQYPALFLLKKKTEKAVPNRGIVGTIIKTIVGLNFFGMCIYLLDHWILRILGIK